MITIVPVISLDDIDLLDVGNAIQIAGTIYSGNGTLYVIPLPDESIDDVDLIGRSRILKMDADEWARFLDQTDLLNVRSEGKAIVRKSQRQIDQMIAWSVFKRDGYRCRYCGRELPLTVDHIDLWEDGGASVEENLISACRRCNKLRGRTPYDEWLKSPDYKDVSKYLYNSAVIKNLEVLPRLGYLKTIRQKKRSR